MEFNIQEWLNWSIEVTVTENDTASKLSSGNIEVYATPAMISLMENTAKTCVDSHLPEGYTTVGTEVNIKHIKATPVGMRVRCEAVLAKVDGKKLYFNIAAWDEQGKIGEGTHNRYIINTEEFLRKVYNRS